MNALAKILPNWRRMDPARRDQLLAEYCWEGLSAGQIAAKFLDASRSAIIGRVHRLQKSTPGLHLGSPNRKRGRAAKTKAPKAPKPSGTPRGRKLRLIAGVEQFQIGSGPKAKSQYDFKTRAEQRASAPPIVISRAAAFDPLPDQAPVAYGSPGCKWPVDGLEGAGLLWCGASKDDDCSYCGAHRNLSYTPPTYRLSVPKGA